jgi:two-component system, response regulator PdtaR
MRDAPRVPARPLRLIAADTDPATCQLYRDALPGMGHELVAVASSAEELAGQCRTAAFDLLIAGGVLFDPDGIAAAVAGRQPDPVPVVLVAASPDQALVERALSDHVFAFLGKPVRPADLGAAVAVAARRSEECRALRQENAGLVRTIEEGKLIERAKGVVARRVGVSEEEAYRRLRLLASERNLKVAEVARSVLAAEVAFEPLDRLPPPGAGRAGTGPRGRGRGQTRASSRPAERNGPPAVPGSPAGDSPSKKSPQDEGHEPGE